MGAYLIQFTHDRYRAVPRKSLTEYIFVHVRLHAYGALGWSEIIRPTEIDGSEIVRYPAGTGKSISLHGGAYILGTEQVKGIATCKDMPTEMRFERTFTEKRRRRELLIHAHLCLRHIIPIWLRNILRTIEVYELKTGSAIDIGYVLRDFILQTGILINSHEPRPSIHVKKSYNRTRLMLCGRSSKHSSFAVFEKKRTLSGK